MRNCKFICLPYFDLCNRGCEHKQDCWNHNGCCPNCNCRPKCDRDWKNFEFSGNIRFRECGNRKHETGFDNKFDNGRNCGGGCSRNYPEFWQDDNFGYGMDGFNDFNNYNRY